MNELQIFKNENGKEAVQCSHLYKSLGLQTTNYKRWYKRNITKNKFAIEGVDFVSLSYPKDKQTDNLDYPLDELESKRQVDFILSLDFAKHLAMQCRSQKGHEVRNYFLLCEQRAKQAESIKLKTLQKELNAYRRLEQIRLIREALRKEVKELKEVIKPITEMQYLTNQLTLNFQV